MDGESIMQMQWHLSKNTGQVCESTGIIGKWALCHMQTRSLARVIFRVGQETYNKHFIRLKQQVQESGHERKGSPEVLLLA